MSTLPLYVISNGELAQQALNAVAIVFGSSTFTTAIKIATLFSIIGAAIQYIQGRDYTIFARWFVVYFAVTTLMIAPKVTIRIKDISNIMKADLTVDNVPLGLGYPASIITNIAHGLVTEFETAFHMPDDVSYNKTGMLFGSKLFRLSTDFQVIDPEVASELNEYVKNCVLGDILISKKYSMSDLAASSNLSELISKNPSNIRGIYIGSEFKTCRAAIVDLKKHIAADINTNGFKLLARRIFGNQKEQQLKNAIATVYDHFKYGNGANNNSSATDYHAISSGATEIMTQNLLINGIRSGILNYGAEAGATAALLNYSDTKAMQQMRLTLATSKNIAIYALPIIHTVLLLLMLGVFPIMMLLALQPSFTSQILKNYFYTLIWIESWPIMFACLNMIVTAYTTSATGNQSLTLSNIDLLALEHSDISNMAGYLMLSIPFISGGLVKGMSSAFNTAASYIGGVLQSSASSGASEAATGNISLGNTSWNNVNANKFDTNSTLFKDAATEQLATGLLRSTTSSGEAVYDSSHAISRLPVNVRASDMLSESFASQAEAAKSAGMQDQQSYEQHVSNAVSDMSNFAESFDVRKSHGESFSSREAVSAAESVSDMKNIATNIAKRNHVDVSDVFKGLVNFSQHASADGSLSIPGKAFGLVGDGKFGLKLNLEHARIGETSTQSNIGRSVDITAEEAQRFSKDLHKVTEYSKTQHAEENRSAAESQLFQLSSSLNKAQTASENYSVHMAESDRLSKSASIVRQHSGQIDSDLNQEIVDYVTKKDGREAAELQFVGKNRPRLEANTREYLQLAGVESKILANYQQNSSGVNPSQKFQAGNEVITGKKSGIITAHNEQSQNLGDSAKMKNVELKQKAESNIFKPDGYNQIVDSIGSGATKIENDLKDKGNNTDTDYEKIKTEVSENIKDGIKKSNSSVYNPFNSIKPKFAENKKESK